MVPIDIYEILMEEIKTLSDSIKSNQIKSHYGTSEGVMKAWDTRGRGKKEQEKKGGREKREKKETIKNAKPAKDILESEESRKVLWDVVQKAHKEYAKAGYTEQQDLKLKYLAKAQGFDAKPEVVAENELKQYAEENKVPILYRGVTDPKYADEFRDGEYWAGRGLMCDGIYTAYDTHGKDVASQYAGDKGEVIQMCLDKDAKIIDYNDLEKEMSDWMRGYSDEAKDFHTKINDLLADPGRFAAAKGYDAINIKEELMVNWGMMVVLNRSKVKVVK